MTDGRDFRLHAFRKVRFGWLKTPTSPKAGNILDGQVSEVETVRQTDAMRAEIDFTAPFCDPGLITSGRGVIHRIENAANRRCGAATEPDEFPLGEDIPKR